MDQIITQENLRQMSDEELSELLFSEGDRLPRITVDEFIFRGQRMIDPLWEIIKNTNTWENGGAEWWAVVHATFILGAIGGKSVITPLIMSLRFADAYNCDWVTEELPSIFGKIGPAVLEPLKEISLDKSNNWLTRTIALDGLAAVTINYPKFSSEVFDFVASFVKDIYEDRYVSGLAGNILLDFCQNKYEKTLLEFARQEEVMATKVPFYLCHFSQQDVLDSFASEKKNLWQYSSNWLNFYNPEEIESRQERWRKENSWWSKWFSWWGRMKLRMKLKLSYRK